MTKPWRHKTNSSNILLVLITLMLVEAEWVKGEPEAQPSSNGGVTFEEEPSRDWSDPLEGSGRRLIVGNTRISRYYFRSSSSNVSLTLPNVNRCLDNFQLTTCLKMLLLDRINLAVDLLREPEIAERDVVFLNGFVSFNRKGNETTSSPAGEPAVADKGNVLSLDEEITDGVMKLFRDRTLRLNLFSRHVVDITPSPCSQKNSFVCFQYKFVKEPETSLERSHEWEGRKRKKGGGGGGMSMMMMIPQMLMLGFLPFTLASLKAMVMNAVMVNMMALNGAIFMTIRNLVFGPRSGESVQYVNYGYSKDRQTQKKRPVLIIHSPAAFLKQPDYHHSKPQNSHFDLNHHVQSKEYHEPGPKKDFPQYTEQGPKKEFHQHHDQSLSPVKEFPQYQEQGPKIEFQQYQEQGPIIEFQQYHEPSPVKDFQPYHEHSLSTVKDFQQFYQPSLTPVKEFSGYQDQGHKLAFQVPVQIQSSSSPKYQEQSPVKDFRQYHEQGLKDDLQKYNDQSTKNDFQEYQDLGEELDGYQFQYEEYDNEPVNGVRDDLMAQNVNGVRRKEPGTWRPGKKAAYSTRRRLFIRPKQRQPITYIS